MASQTALDELKAELAQLEKIQPRLLALRQAIDILEGRSILVAPDDAPRMDFSGLGIVEAAKRLIRETGGPLGTKDIAEQILKRGVVTTSKNYVPTVYATLDNSPEFVRVGGAGRKGKWQLKEKHQG
jgi:hypothetical protein